MMSRVNAETLYLSTIIALMAAFTLRYELCKSLYNGRRLL